MSIKNNRSYFKAVLKNEQGETLVDGTAIINIEEQTVTFKSAFVPLYPIGTPMEIVRVHEGKEIHRFCGKVYLSDKKLIRIVSVIDELLPGSEYFYCDCMEFSVEVTPCFSFEVKEKMFIKNFFRRKEKLPETFEATVVEITEKYLIFQFDNREVGALKMAFWKQSTPAADFFQIEKGHRFLLRTKSNLAIKETIIEVVDPFYFGERPSYKCNFIEMPLLEHIKLKDFLWAYNITQNKLFW